MEGKEEDQSNAKATPNADDALRTHETLTPEKFDEGVKIEDRDQKKDGDCEIKDEMIRKLKEKESGYQR